VETGNQLLDLTDWATLTLLPVAFVLSAWRARRNLGSASTPAVLVPTGLAATFGIAFVVYAFVALLHALNR